MASINVTLRGFSTPDCAIPESRPGVRQNGIVPIGSISLSDIEASVLSDLCDQYRAEVFKKAGKPDPRVQPEA